MPLPAEIFPSEPQRVIDLVAAAGLNTSDWSNYKRGATNPGANPKYCYEWALEDPNRIVVCNLWYESMKEIDGGVEQHLALRDTVRRQESDPTRRARRARMESILAKAFSRALPVRVIVLNGESRKAGVKQTVVRTRVLDPQPWSITFYDEATGSVTLRRGTPRLFVDQFSASSAPPDGSLTTKLSEVVVRERSAAVRAYALVRANGKCEFCGEVGFQFTDGRIYLETHHIESLASGGPDSISNVAALCANHHREAHFGARASEIAIKLRLARSARSE